MEGGKLMDLFQELTQERDKIMMVNLIGGKVDMSRLRELARKFSEMNNAELIVDGTEQELWESVTKFFKDILN